MTKLLTLSGRNLGEAPKFSLFSLSGAQLMKVDPRTLTDEDAGLYMLYWINQTYPGVTYENIVEAAEDGETMQGIFGSVGKLIGKGIKSVARVAKVPLKIATAPMTLTAKAIDWGTKKGVKGIVQYFTPKQTLSAAQQGQLTAQDQAMLAQIGAQTKSNYSQQILGMNPIVLFGGGALVIGGLVFLLTRGRK